MEAAASPERSRKWAAAALTLVVAALLLSPVVRTPPVDSFPLSTFPMFSNLIEPVVDIDFVVGIDESGGTVTLDPETIAGTDEIIVAGSIVRQAVRGGTTALALLCAEVAVRAAERDGIVAIEVRTDRVDAIGWYSGKREPLSSITQHRCAVAR